MKNKNQYYSHRIKLEKLKQRTWTLIVVVRALFFLAIVIDYLRQ